MLKADPGTILFEANSNMVTGLSIVIFDIIFLGLIKGGCQWLCSIRNVHLVYNKREAISPRSSPVGVFCGSPVGSGGLVHALSLLIAVATCCTIVLGFSITGKTVPRYEAVDYASVVEIGNTPARIDFSREYKAAASATEPALVSKRLIGMMRTYHCMINNQTHFNLYASAYRDERLDTTLVPITEAGKAATGAECVTRGQFLEEWKGPSFGMRVGTLAVRCNFGETLEDGVRIGRVGQSGLVLSRVELAAGTCPLQLSALECFGDSQRRSCAGVGRGLGGDRDAVYAVLVADAGHATEHFVDAVAGGGEFAAGASGAAGAQRLARNMAYVARVGLSPSIQQLALAGLTRVRHAARLQRRAGSARATEVRKRAGGAGAGAVVAAAVGVWGVGAWMWASVVRGRRGRYNRFADVGEVAALVRARAKEAAQEGAAIGVRRDWPAVGCGAQGEVGGADWVEEEIR